jgi:glycosyltransferase involved in cell wall biosynthesis
MADAPLPRLLYIADVAVESSQHGSALMFRALETYPADRLRIVETGVPSQPARRLADVPYTWLPIGLRRLLDSRLHGLYSAWLTWRAPAHAGRVLASLSGFRAEAVATVGHGFGWITAAEAARRLDVPLHFIVHDDWPRASAIAGACRPWLDRTFGRLYRGAASRLCVSPFMADAYARRYDAAGSVMYPSRSKDCPVFPPKPACQIGDRDMVIGYGGNSSAQLVECLRTLASALPGTRTRLAVFGSFDEHAQRTLLAASPAISFHGFMPYQQMIRELREIADVLFVPMSFDPAERANMAINFPSKLTDYTATGVPLLIHGAADSSAVRWARAEQDLAEIVDEPGPSALAASIVRLRADTNRRTLLAAAATSAGQRYFDPASARGVLSSTLIGAASGARGAAAGERA